MPEQIIISNMPVIKNLEGIIKSRGISYSKLSRLAGLPDRSVSDFISGNKYIKARDIAVLAEVMCVEVGELFK